MLGIAGAAGAAAYMFAKRWRQAPPVAMSVVTPAPQATVPQGAVTQTYPAWQTPRLPEPGAVRSPMLPAGQQYVCPPGAVSMEESYPPTCIMADGSRVKPYVGVVPMTEPSTLLRDDVEANAFIYPGPLNERYRKNPSLLIQNGSGVVYFRLSHAVESTKWVASTSEMPCTNAEILYTAWDGPPNLDPNRVTKPSRSWQLCIPKEYVFASHAIDVKDDSRIAQNIVGLSYRDKNLCY